MSAAFDFTSAFRPGLPAPAVKFSGFPKYNFVGGHTQFFEPDQISVAPRRGMALVFHHPQLHEGAVIEEGVKYVLRTDVMYAPPDGNPS